MLRTSAAAALAALACLAASGAGAEDVRSAQTPSRNIACMATPPGPDMPHSQLRCDIRETSARRPPSPPDCDLDWGDAFELDPTGRGRLVCHGDTVADPAAPVIGYGTQWRAYGFVCTSQPNGLTCVNPAGHGFSLSRAVQKVF